MARSLVFGVCTWGIGTFTVTLVISAIEWRCGRDEGKVKDVKYP